MKKKLIIAGIISMSIVAFGFWSYSSKMSTGTKLSIRNGNAAQIMKTSNWFSSAYSFPSEAIFALPGAYKIDKAGVSISSPQPTATERTVYGSFAPECVIKWPGAIMDSRIVHYSDRDLSVELRSGDTSSTVRIAMGSPWLYLNTNEQIRLDCEGFKKEVKDNYVLYQNGEKGYILQRSKVIPERFRIGLLPSMKESTVKLFIDDIWDTGEHISTSWQVSASTVHSQLIFSDAPVLTTVWPHQVPYLTDSHEWLDAYQTQLGQLHLVKAKSIDTKADVPTLAKSFVSVSGSAKASIITAIREDADRIQYEAVPDGVYFKGTWLGSVSTLVQLSDAYNLPEIREKLLNLLERELTLSTSDFFYDKERKMYIAKNPEFGNEEGNDHHFHYGYYIRSAAILIQARPELRSTVEPMINEMIGDIATIDGTSQRYPLLRHFSIYEGHSWADGDAKFADGNNQESSSEALNAWYAIHLWGEGTSNKIIADTGAWLFSEELRGINAYWFGYKNQFPKQYKHDIASVIWGGKRDFATWFSGERGHIYGIQLLPITPASEYLSQISIPSITLKVDNELISHEWADLYVAYLSFHNPELAQQAMGSVESFAGSKLKSLYLHTVHSNIDN